MDVGNLVVKRYKKKIIDLVQKNDVTIISADTGTGKSTLIPLYLSEICKKVIITQPRSMAAISLANYVSKLIEKPTGEIVGYNTKYEKLMSEENRILYITDGMALVNFNKYLAEDAIIILDEVHEYNLNIEALLALFKEQLKQNTSNN